MDTVVDEAVRKCLRGLDQEMSGNVGVASAPLRRASDPGFDGMGEGLFHCEHAGAQFTRVRSLREENMIEPRTFCLRPSLFYAKNMERIVRR